MEIETAEQCFIRLLKVRKSRKFETAINSIKQACDITEKIKGEMNYTKIAELTKANFAGPVYSTIMNDEKGHKLYIALRMAEYKKRSSRPPERSSGIPYKPNYPSEDLDLKTKAFIDQLRSRNAFLEKEARYLEKQLNELTKEKPLSLAKVIEAGANPDLSMKLFESEHDKVATVPLNIKLLKALRKVLEIPEKTDNPLFLEKRNGKKALLWNGHSETHMLLNPEEWHAIEEAVKKGESADIP